ncbi:PH domain-containing protein [Rhodococcoides corynebacterioides]|uniref:PH domain-containing protein n=1 Tax=Rhodococcoides corynebacterioides TaxID=53972 RepID=A0ABS7NZR2_9NOCA|nr:PH domain-containing protein [Rhodococcus corynebacterioides]MBY6365627.1 PH domain-containing protein [Rhodococcus corynebacterioides]MBY6406358.1 PH domain-containing protein [Rhodococcus corynebacterioides]
MSLAPPDGGDAAEAREEAMPWARLDRRMLLVHPVTEVVRLLPVLVVSFVVGTSSGNHLWSAVVLVIVVGAAIARWLTTSYRLGPVHVQLRTGVLQKKVLSIPRGRIRSVDVRANALHRLLGLAVVTVGTGQHAGTGETFELNALDARVVPALRDGLLETSAAAAPDTGIETGTRFDDRPTTPAPPVRELARVHPAWVRYAPFTLTGIVVVGAAAGLLGQSGAAGAVASSAIVDDTYRRVVDLGATAAVVVAVVAALVVSSVVAAVRYLLVYGNLVVTDDGERLRVSHGVVSTRHSSFDRTRLRGASVRRPLLLRLAGGARLDAVMTGVSADEHESSLILPPAPRSAVSTTAAALLPAMGDAVTARLVVHGPVARRRRVTRALLPPAAVAVAVAGYAVSGRSVPWWVWAALVVATLAASALAADRYAALGHRAEPGLLVTEHGSLDRRRVVLDARGVVAWTVRQTFFQRRAGVATLVAATAAGTGAYRVLDVPVERAWAIAEAAAPGATDVWGADR